MFVFDVRIHISGLQAKRGCLYSQDRWSLQQTLKGRREQKRNAHAIGNWMNSWCTEYIMCWKSLVKATDWEDRCENRSRDQWKVQRGNGMRNKRAGQSLTHSDRRLWRRDTLHHALTESRDGHYADRREVCQSLSPMMYGWFTDPQTCRHRRADLQHRQNLRDKRAKKKKKRHTSQISLFWRWHSRAGGSWGRPSGRDVGPRCPNISSQH